MKTKSILISILLLGTIVFNSCREDLLDIKQKATTDYSEYFNEDVIDEAVANCYSQWTHIVLTGFYMKDCLSDDVYTGGNARNDNAEYEALNEKTFTSSNSNFYSYMWGLYNLIYNAHCVIENFGDYMDNENVQRGMAEAYFFRAYAYIELVSLYGTPQFVDHILSQSEYRQSNGDRKELWDLIISDLEYAINSGYLTEKVLGDQESSIRISKQAAQAYLGKALLYQATYDNPEYGNLNDGSHGWEAYSFDASSLLSKAVTNLNAVVDGGQFALIDDFSDLYHMEADYSDEYVLQNNNPAALIGTNDTWEFYSAHVSVLTTTWRFQGSVFSATSDSEFGSDYYTAGGYGFRQGVTKSYTVNGETVSPYGLVDAFESSPGEEDSQRRLWTYRSWDEVEDMGVAMSGTAYGTSGYFNMKRIYRKEGGTNNYLGDMDLTQAYTYYAGSYANWPHMRYSEVLLMCAEANYLAGNTAKALECINTIRSRAGADAYTSIDMDKIKLEYQLELACEGFRYQNLVRWGDAATVLATQGKYIPSFTNGSTVSWYDNSANNPGFKTSKNELLPIPSDEFVVNPNMVQNPGYSGN